MKTEPRNCLNCGTRFQASLRELRRGNAKFCSLRCSSQYNTKRRPRKLKQFTCAHCGKNFFRKPSSEKNSKSGLMFCSKTCKDRAQRIDGCPELHPAHYGVGKYVKYRDRALKNLPHRCSKCGYDTHPTVLEVHHRDGDRLNNSISNLQFLCPTCHAVHHFLTKTGKWADKK
jgi:predicted  nucleic acid-binding Zn-ribbon protein